MRRKMGLLLALSLVASLLAVAGSTPAQAAIRCKRDKVDVIQDTTSGTFATRLTVRFEYCYKAGTRAKKTVSLYWQISHDQQWPYHWQGVDFSDYVASAWHPRCVPSYSSPCKSVSFKVVGSFQACSPWPVSECWETYPGVQININKGDWSRDIWGRVS